MESQLVVCKPRLTPPKGGRSQPAPALAAVLVSATILVAAAGCTSKQLTDAGDFYVSGSYDQAVYKCAEALREDPDDEEAQQLIQNAFRAAVDKHGSAIKQLSGSTDRFRSDRLVAEYAALVKLNDTVRQLPPLRSEDSGQPVPFEIVEYTESVLAAKQQAAEAHYQEGVTLARSGEPTAFKEAARHFTTALSHVAGYKDAQKKYDECRAKAITTMGVIPFEDKSGKAGRYGALSEMVIDDIVKKVLADRSASEFLQIVSRDQLESVMKEQKLGLTGAIDDKTAAKVGKLLGARDIVTGKITQISYSSPGATSKTEQKKERVQIRQEEYKDKKGKTKRRPIWGDVYATVTVHTKVAQATVSGSYRIIAVETALLKKAEATSGEAKFESKWAACSGDERAYNESLCGSDERVAPGEEEMVRQAFTQMSNKLAESFTTYARQ